MDVMVKLKDEADAAVVQDVVATMGLRLRPVHPGTQDAGMATYSTVEVPDEQTAREVSERLTGLEEVEGAYVQPSPGLP
ncbi:MAG: hypothetical protein MSC31_03855 [Solirubrobacteraceae bacterium MAG38_C4-C5]|nr:hypothetical protein [Candidatus Siliceabacter maunaloa]